MNTLASGVPGSVRSSRPLLTSFATLNAVLAWLGGIGLITGAIDLGDRLNQRLPLDSPVFGGIALMLVVAVPLTILARMSWMGHESTSHMAVITGLLLMGWIVVQLLFIREFSWFHPTYLAIGAGLVIVGRRADASAPDH